MTMRLDWSGRVWVIAGDGYAETDDAGEARMTPTVGPGHDYRWSVVINPVGPESVFLTVVSGPMRAYRVGSAMAYFYHRQDLPDNEGDGGESWDRLSKTGLLIGSGAARAILAAGRTSGGCYATNDRGLYRTTDFGNSWDRIEVPWDGTRRTAVGLAIVAWPGGLRRGGPFVRSEKIHGSAW